MPRVDVSGRHPATQQIMRWFDSSHLPAHVRPVPEACEELAHHMLALLGDGPELTAGLRHLLEAKDAFTRQQVAILSEAGWPGEANTPTPVAPSP
jgi:hypothetical protein